MRFESFSIVAVGLGFLLFVAGFVTESSASGNGGLCGGQIREELQSNGTWKATGHICAGICPEPGPGLRVECELTKSGPMKQSGGHMVHSRMCACVTYGPDPDGGMMIIHTQMDPFNPDEYDPDDPNSKPACDVESEWESGEVVPQEIQCDGQCPGAQCRTNSNAVVIVPGVRVRAPGCVCP